MTEKGYIFSENTPPAVAVCGSSIIKDPSVERISFEVGFEIASKGWTLVCGGMGGVMEAACRGVRRAREEKGATGLAVGILPTQDFRSANPYCDVVIPTGIGFARNALVVKSGGAVIVINGSAGTLSEASFAWQDGLPLVVMETTGGWAARLAAMGKIDDRERSPVLKAVTAEDAVALIGNEFGLGG